MKFSNNDLFTSSLDFKYLLSLRFPVYHLFVSATDGSVGITKVVKERCKLWQGPTGVLHVEKIIKGVSHTYRLMQKDNALYYTTWKSKKTVSGDNTYEDIMEN